MPMPPVVVFSTTSDIEASVVLALLDSQGIAHEVEPPYYSVKEAVFPFVKFPGVDTILGPEMKSTGEVMGVGRTFGEAFVKSQLGASVRLPTSGKVFLSVKNSDKPRAVQVAKALVDIGFSVVATKGTAAAISSAGIPVEIVNKVAEGRPHIVDMIKNNEFDPSEQIEFINNKYSWEQAEKNWTKFHDEML